jgi:hypothetical protein
MRAKTTNLTRHEFTIGGGAREKLVVRINGRERPDAVDNDDGNWLHASVEIIARRFAGSCVCSLRTEDFADFRSELALLTDNPTATASFSSMEDQLALRISASGSGELTIAGHVSDGAIGDCLQFKIEADQSSLPQVLQDIDRILAEFPIR